DFQRNQRAEKFFRLLHVRRDVVVDEKDQRLLHAPDFLDDLLGRPARLRVREIGLDRAELASKVAAASRFDESHWQIAFSFEDRAIGTKSAERRTLPLAIFALKATI